MTRSVVLLPNSPGEGYWAARSATGAVVNLPDNASQPLHVSTTESDPDNSYFRSSLVSGGIVVCKQRGFAALSVSVGGSHTSDSTPAVDGLVLNVDIAGVDEFYFPQFLFQGGVVSSTLVIPTYELAQIHFYVANSDGQSVDVESGTFAFRQIMLA